MKTFQDLVKETLEVQDLEELESAADLFQFGIEKGHYNKRQADQFNVTYWKMKNTYLAYEVAKEIKGNKLDIISMVTSAPTEIKDDKKELLNYINGRVKALKGKMNGMK
ncbi:MULTISPECIES: hypothetical protein [Clostridium]|uniref:hypothetical protein n=1 Tax=Clostridium TaxID=1485 RepID=UPI001C0C7792|nr:hypothetical protein [Clostridium bowmanii]MBU3191975.1 hypothetical protein [Clostridium bowmanii]MCA1076212.1 hypothetical protein [Clostridium bowmanii]